MPIEMEIRELRPSIVIGLGGTGKIVLTRLRAYLEKRFGDVPKQRIRLLELDIDPEEEVARVDDRETKLREDEFINLGGVPLEEIRREFNRGGYPELQSWFNPTITVGERTLLKAAHQVRQAGRLAFHWHLARGAQHLYKRFKDTVEELVDLYKRDVGEEATIEIYVISSLCGGTGSGMLVDVGFVLQEVLGARRDYATLYGIFTTPGFYRSAPQFPLRANTWATAQELNYFMTTRPEDYKFKCIEVRGVDVERITIGGKPYDQVYLVDSNLQDGSALLGVEPMVRALTGALGLLVTSRIGGEATSRRADVAALHDIEAGTVFSSPGISALVFPADEVVSWCAAKGVQEIVEEKILTPLTEERMEEVEARVEEFLRSLGWEAENLWTSLSRDDRGHPVAPRLREDPRLAPGALEALPREGLYEAVRDRLKLALPELETQALEKVQGSREVKEKGFANELDDAVEALIKDETRGLAYVLEFLRRLEGRLGDIRRNCEAGLYRAKEGEERVKASIPVVERTFRDRVRRAGRFFGGDPRTARDNYLRVGQNLLDLTVERRAWEETIKLVSDATDTAEAKRREVEETMTAFQGLTKERLPKALLESRKNIMDMDRVRERPVLLGPVGREEEVLEINLNRIYEEYSPLALGELRRTIYGSREQAPRIAELLGLSPEELKQKLLEWGKEAFQPIRDIRLEDWIEERGEKSPPEYLSETCSYAAYMWHPTKARARAEDVFIQENTIIGLEDEENSIYVTKYADTPELSKEGTSLVSTGDPHRLTILKMGHGLRLRDFAWLGEYLGPYQEQMKKLAPVHVFPEFNLNPNGKGKERREIFARALAYGFLNIVEDPLRRRPPEVIFRTEEQEESLSDKGIFDALWVFVHDEDLVAKVSKVVREHEASTERQKVLKELSTFADNFADGVSENERWLARILQDDVRPGR